MKLSHCTTLHFNGQCETAFKFYERCLGGKIGFMLKWGESPMAANAPAGLEDKILHARISVGGSDLVGGDVPPKQYEQPKGFSIMLSMDDPEEGRRIFEALSENGKIQVPMQETFWAVRYGFVVDQFGIPWEVNCGRGT